MVSSKNANAFAGMTRNEYRPIYKKEHAAFLKGRTGKDIEGIYDVVFAPRLVDMKKIRERTAKEVSERIERLYANDGRFLNPSTPYPPFMLDKWGSEYALNARGIYYRHSFSPEWVTCTRKIWVPSLEGIDWDAPNEQTLRQRAQQLQLKSIRNERRPKGEYVWEADAWSNVFCEIRNDLCFELDKHETWVETPKTYPVECTLNGEVSLDKRIPDLTFSLATFEKSDFLQPIFAEELLQESLTKLLVHPKCGLIADPKASGESYQAFPFALYEAKGWAGDCREARHQVTTTAASYLDMLDNLARDPGPTKSARKYQTPTSHQYQIFCLTQFGAYWHILVGYRRPRQLEEHAGAQGMSETVYVFQRIWSGRVIEERTAWELLTLINQIHLWAKTEFRRFVIDHLKPWHKFCGENYLLDWNSVYNSPQNLKRKREGDEDGDLRLPSWTNLATDAHRRKIQVVAKKSLKRAEHEQRLLKGKGKADDQPRKANWNLICVNGECAYSRLFNFTSADDYMEHQRSFCHYPDEELEKMRPEIVDFFNSGLESELMKTKKVLLESDFRELLIGRE